MTDMPDICVECSHASPLEPVAPFIVAHGGKHATMEDRQTFCPACGTVSYIGGQAGQHEWAAAILVRMDEELYQRTKSRLIARFGSGTRTSDLSQLAACAIDAVRSAQHARSSAAA